MRNVGTDVGTGAVMSDPAGIGAVPVQTAEYGEVSFRYLLESESKRSERSGHGYHVLLVYHTDEKGVVRPLDSVASRTVMALTSRCVRETDYIGWYRDGHVVGGVLTVVESDSIANLRARVLTNLREQLLREFGVEGCAHFHVRIYHHNELKEGLTGNHLFVMN